ncbi:sulfurtransferase TusA family protein [Brevibacillus porteri]|uniref:sulfurtransferase TusA family protein n=1 Tax=Brevibacillus porteri TaxID=2126350 RepID=UPI003D1C72E4
MSVQSIFTADKTLDCKGLACPMPVVRTKKAMEEMLPGQVMEVQATDKGSMADLKSWANNTGHEFLGSIQEGEVFKHFLRKASTHEVKEETNFLRTISNEELQKKLEANEKLTLIDVREPAEYAFHRIPVAISIPLGVLGQRLDELQPDDDIYIICRSGKRSDMACQLLAEKGFTKITNVVPGMSGWNGTAEKQ